MWMCSVINRISLNVDAITDVPVSKKTKTLPLTLLHIVIYTRTPGVNEVTADFKL